MKYGEVFTADVRKEFGKIICHKYHIKGICDTNCKLKASRVLSSKEKIESLIEFAEFAEFAFYKHNKLKNVVQNKKLNDSQG